MSGYMSYLFEEEDDEEEEEDDAECRDLVWPSLDRGNFDSLSSLLTPSVNP